jgi:uncharacterized protein YndB with AHSA1/START domain
MGNRVWWGSRDILSIRGPAVVKLGRQQDAGGEGLMDDRGLKLHLQRELPAPCSLVFEALVDPVKLAKWWGPKGFTTPSVQLDVRVGGSYRIAMQPPSGDLFHLSGEFREVDPPTRLAYTFRWEPPDPEDRETVVTISLRDFAESTELTVDQGVFGTEQRLALHTRGWAESLDRLEALVSATDR